MKRAWLNELHRQWAEARGRRTAPTTRGFRRDWDTLLDAAGLHSADDQKAAFREAEAEEAQGHIRLHRLKGRKNIVLKVEVPVTAEGWLLRHFGKRPAAELQAASLAEIDRAEGRSHARYPQLWIDWCGKLRTAFKAGKSLRPLDWQSPDAVRTLIDLTYAFTSREWSDGALVREVSVEMGLGSKGLERRRRTLEACLRQMFGREMPLESLGIVLSDSRTDIGGVLTLHFPTGEEQIFDHLKEIYTVSLGDLERAERATTPALRVLTIENTKTTLRRLVATNSDESTLLMGCSFPTKALVRLLELLPRGTPMFHFGDTDPAGYHILAKLREKTERPVHPFLMRHRPGQWHLTEYDRALLPRLLDDQNLADVRADLSAMKTSGLKGDFEQETLGLPDLERWPFFRRASAVA
jgi:hypothetical protein